MTERLTSAAADRDERENDREKNEWAEALLSHRGASGSVKRGAPRYQVRRVHAARDELRATC